ncbi:MAG: ABC transporter ATP-binding protein [Betaproteobacteria bacterium]|nr:ABC transporter ATP-binding protein [Betaproteobacteria bacterium]
MLRYENVSASYGGFQALKDVSFEVREGERVGVFGHNGAGKTTLLRCGIGDVGEVGGRVLYRGEPVESGEVYRNARRGIGFVPQGHNVFRELSVAQNLTIAGLMHDRGGIEEMYGLFPILRERRDQLAGSLSGGQQQMLALGMALMTRPSILLLDEPCTGLAPIVVRDVLHSLRSINERSRTTIVIVEQNVQATLREVERALVVKTGRLIFDGPSAELAGKENLWELF